VTSYVGGRHFRRHPGPVPGSPGRRGLPLRLRGLPVRHGGPRHKAGVTDGGAQLCARRSHQGHTGATVATARTKTEGARWSAHLSPSAHTLAAESGIEVDDRKSIEGMPHDGLVGQPIGFASLHQCFALRPLPPTSRHSAIEQEAESHRESEPARASVFGRRGGRSQLGRSSRREHLRRSWSDRLEKRPLR
jgi:hypothetical protein